MTLYQLICEWDIGQEGKVFKSREAALVWASSVWDDCGFDEGPTFAEAYLDNLIYAQGMELVE